MRRVGLAELASNPRNIGVMIMDADILSTTHDSPDIKSSDTQSGTWKLDRNSREYPWIKKLVEVCETANPSRLHEIDQLIKAALELDEDTRNAFFKVLLNEKYGSFTFVFRAGKCIGFDWKNLHRKPKQ